MNSIETQYRIKYHVGEYVVQQRDLTLQRRDIGYIHGIAYPCGPEVETWSGWENCAEDWEGWFGMGSEKEAIVVMNRILAKNCAQRKDPVIIKTVSTKDCK